MILTAFEYQFLISKDIYSVSTTKQIKIIQNNTINFYTFDPMFQKKSE